MNKRFKFCLPLIFCDNFFFRQGDEGPVGPAGSAGLEVSADWISNSRPVRKYNNTIIFEEPHTRPQYLLTECTMCFCLTITRDDQ